MAMKLSVLNLFAFILLRNIIVSRGALLFSPCSSISWNDLTASDSAWVLDSTRRAAAGIILVSQDGVGDTTTVQAAVDQVPKGNSNRVKILISPGFYREKVLVPFAKPCISFIGKDNAKTVIWYNLQADDEDLDGQPVGTYNSATVAVESDYFCANAITFQNTAPAAKPGEEGKQAVALRLTGERSLIYRCRILAAQDTLFDHWGTHYILESFVQGSIDFIFGSGRSLYEKCHLNSIAESYGAVAASQRNNITDNFGFSFVKSKLTGTGSVYLGRAWGKYATVVYSYCQLENIIIPGGWSDLNDENRRSTAFFGEYNCNGDGANLKGRVPWAKSLTYKQAKPYLGKVFIDGDQWLNL
ncbi:pectinesterase QRT1-like [Zingiber officinale]|uniref:Pectinesterase n=1 Tax=Zingiber officinale TaxID=94328 RepID=A0A8J5ERE2_ZINOF|nr:pectinesterase QRT1-like [Zingiber officinale]XP_042445661.1 pectinesterase QRT1-like [Zingiber officinale]KAG6471593.1 hypothetical protein ZIOFF_069037 [Zingiber officinale]KAG6473348.1 hypothetical protein ZIOFF_067263 [Zingiber officinale]